ncbi:MAG: NADH:ubiquinone reductase (Na(+)-transporting) subunit D [Candidatus Omnitrophica bacterium]|nr:NADH:ubiquinone reductase (Na(+)-transporting) subunit D [Candidatus Omnitrophota bacterium]
MKIYRLIYTRAGRIFVNGVWKDNPIFCMILGICSTLAVTNRVENALAMGAGVTFVLLATSLLISSLRKIIPARIRMITYMLVISTFVICVDRFLKAYFPRISEQLGPYVGLIITNCILMGRAEAFAIKNPLGYSLLDAFSCGLGYSYTLLILSVIREILAFGTILGRRVMPGTWTNWVIMAMPAGGFVLLALYLWIMRNLAKLEPEKGGI